MTIIFNRKQIEKRRQKLRNNQTRAEQKLWHYLSRRQINGYKFRRQYSINYYIVDFYCARIKLAIELDGDSHYNKVAKLYDAVRQKHIESFGIKFIRFTNDEVYSNIEGVLEKLTAELTSPSPSFPRRGNYPTPEGNMSKNSSPCKGEAGRGALTPNQTFMQKGKFIVLYGINNLGKSTQARILIERLKQQNIQAQYLKYPIYDLEPTGPQINEVLRGGNPQHISEIELQKLYAQNRFDYQPTLEKTLAEGTWILAEDYIGTGLAWGVTKGAPLEVLEEQNKGLLHEDLAILLDGERFMDGKEHAHLHESDDDLMSRCRLTHQELAKRYGWQTVSAAGTTEEVNERLWKEIQRLLP